jgi:uncharacterized membrane protein
MERIQAYMRPIFGSGMIGVGLIGLRYGDFVSVLRQIPAWVPARAAIVYAAAALMLLGGIALLFERTAAAAARVLFYYLVAWVVLLDVPMIIAAPRVVNNWAAPAHIVVLLAGGWVVFAALTAPEDGSARGFASSERGVRVAQILFGLSLPLLGLAHFAYLNLTTPLIPAFLPSPTFWAYFTGAAQIAAGIGVVFSILPRLAATPEAVLLTMFTFLVWIPAIAATPTAERPWTALAVSWACSAGAWVVAASIPRDVRSATRA